MSSQTFNPETGTGSVSGQAASGETVTITITKPDGTIDTVTTTTQADLTLAPATYTPTQAGTHSYVFHIDADSQFTAADSTPGQFTATPALTPRTITGTFAP